MVEPELDAPGRLKDLDKAQRAAWQRHLLGRFASTNRYLRSIRTDSDLYGPDRWQFLDPLQRRPARARRQSISWPGFPHTLMVTLGRSAALTAADQLASTANNMAKAELFTRNDNDPKGFRPFPVWHRCQDEYLEWQVERDAEDRITRVTLTCESPEYWSLLADGEPAAYFQPHLAGAPAQSPIRPPAGNRGRLLELYRRLVGTEVAEEDLFFSQDVYGKGVLDKPDRPPVFRKGQYNPFNIWNTQFGIVHLTHPDNALWAEIQIVGDGTVLRRGPTRNSRCRPLDACCAVGCW